MHLDLSFFNAKRRDPAPQIICLILLCCKSGQPGLVGNQFAQTHKKFDAPS